MGELATRQTSNAVSQTRSQGQEDDSERGNQGEVVSQVKGLLGREESRQEVIQKLSDSAISPTRATLKHLHMYSRCTASFEVCELTYVAGSGGSVDPVTDPGSDITMITIFRFLSFV